MKSYDSFNSRAKPIKLELSICRSIHTRMILNSLYRSQTKLRKGNVFTGVYPFTGGGGGDGGYASSDDQQMSLAGDGYVQRVAVADCGFSWGGGGGVGWATDQVCVLTYYFCKFFVENCMKIHSSFGRASVLLDAVMQRHVRDARH